VRLLDQMIECCQWCVSVGDGRVSTLLVEDWRELHDDKEECSTLKNQVLLTLLTRVVCVCVVVAVVVQMLVVGQRMRGEERCCRGKEGESGWF